MNLLSYEGILELSQTAREQGKKIVFTNGCFDLIHPGHIYSLYRARREGDILVVGLNSDTSVRALKGEARPIFSEKERAETLAAFSFVDYIAIFSELTPLTMIITLRPQVLVKGGDYAPEDVVGKKEVEADGGRLVIIPELPGFSTTKMIETIAGAK